MAGHSKFKNIMYRKGAQDKKRAKVFTKLIREITVAARAGVTEPEKNPRLRSAVSAANSANMPKDTIERAILRGGDNQKGDAFEEICYEGFSSGGVSVIIDALTDNRNRAAAEIRSCFSKHGGHLGEAGNVSHMYAKVGLIHYSSDEKKSSEIFDKASDLGAEDVVIDNLGCDVFCQTGIFHDLRSDLEKIFGSPDSAGLIWKAKNLITIGESDAQKVIGLIEELDSLEDVQSVYSDYDIPEEIMNKLVA